MTRNNKEFLIRVSADIAKAQADMRRMSDEIAKTGGAARSASKPINNLGLAFSTMGAAAAAYLVIASAIKALHMADEFRTLEQRIKTATKQTGDFVKVNKQLFESAQETGTAMADTVATFQRLSLARKELGATNDQIITVTKTVQQLGVMSGASGTAMQAGLLQFGQAMSGVVVRAEEFNSWVENIPAVVDRIAIGLGKSKGELRQMVLDGKLLSKDAFGALLDQSGEVSKEFAEIPVNLQRATKILDEAMKKFLADLDHATNATTGIAWVMNRIANNLAAAGTYVNPTGMNKFNLLFKERIRLTKEIQRLEKDVADNTKSPYVDYVAELKNLKSELESVNKELKAMQDENVRAIQSGKQHTEQADAAEDYEASLKDVNQQLKTAIILQKEQAQKVDEYVARIKKVKEAYADIRSGIGNKGGAPDIIDISGQSKKSEQLFDKGDYEGAAKAAEKARNMIKELGDAGGESDIVLRGLLKRAEDAELNALGSIKTSSDASLQQTNQVITDLLTRAEELKALKVGLDSAAAQAQATSLMAALQAQFSANPLVIPVVLSQSGDINVPTEQAVQGVAEPMPIKRAGGGPIVGPGTGTSDSVLMWGSNGEFMQPEASVQYYGRGFMELIRRRQLPRFADGGLIGAPALPSFKYTAPNTNTGTPINLYLDGQKFPVQADQDVANAIQRVFHQEALKRGR
ncbi:tape measure protein [Sedimenticola selenatireducens]|uniref:tape measure protein n=1 Tax=Sedimenticola selenatireducens TaxID=191960 RepID=UPI002AAAA3CE|nr:tape measure protein [Sedimenticola selenatireducens]